jgi:hypothetical protein
MERGGKGGVEEGGERAGNCPGLGQQNFGHLTGRCRGSAQLGWVILVWTRNINDNNINL